MDEDLEELYKLSSVEEVILSHNPIGDAGVAHISALANLRFLNIRGTNTSNDAMQHISKLSELRHLDISATNVTNAALSLLSQLKHLERLNISDLKLDEPVDLSGFPSLQRVDAYKLEVPVITADPYVEVVTFD